MVFAVVSVESTELSVPTRLELASTLATSGAEDVCTAVRSELESLENEEVALTSCVSLVGPADDSVLGNSSEEVLGRSAEDDIALVVESSDSDDVSVHVWLDVESYATE